MGLSDESSAERLVARSTVRLESSVTVKSLSVGKRLKFTVAACLLAWAAGGQSWAEDVPDGDAKRAEIHRHDGGRLVYYHWPSDGPSLLLIPGSWSEYRQYDAVRAHLDQDVNLVIVELPGHGRSWPPAIEGSIENFAHDVLRVTDALGWKLWYAGGHSIGGMIAIELAGQRPEQVAGVISIEGWTNHHVSREAFSGHNYNTLSETQKKQRQQGHSKTLSRLSKEQIAAFAAIWRRWDGLPLLRSTCARVLEIWGDRNRPRPRRQAMRIPERSNIQLHWIAGASHSLLLERPEEVAAVINRFLHPRGGPPPKHPAKKVAAVNVPHARNNPASPLMLDWPHLPADPTKIDFDSLPVLKGRHAVISREDPQWKFRLHSYLTHFDGRYWCMWSHGPVIEDRARQHVRYSTSPDGLRWSEPKILVGPPKEGYGYIARGLWIRDSELLALASLFEAPGYHGGDLELVAFRWNQERGGWESAGRVWNNALNNFPPKRLPTGEWMMTRRASDRSVSLLTGGIKAINNWRVSQPSSFQRSDGNRPEEPYWWILPDGDLVALFRDQGGSKRLLRSFSTDNARTWTSRVRTNFPDAMSKFNALRTSRGYYVLVSNPNPRGRRPLCLSVSGDGLIFTRMARLPIPSQPGETVQYPHIIERDGYLLVVFSRNKTAIEVVKVPLIEVDRLRSNNSPAKGGG